MRSLALVCGLWVSCAHPQEALKMTFVLGRGSSQAGGLFMLFMQGLLILASALLILDISIATAQTTSITFLPVGTQASKSAVSYVACGNGLVAKGDLHGTIADFTAAIAFDPDLAIAYCNRCSACQMKGLEDVIKRANTFQTVQTSLAKPSFSYIFADKPITASSSVRFRQVQGYLMIIPVSINGAGPFDFIFDTGASATIIDREIARQLSLPSANAGSIKSGAATKLVTCCRLGILAVGARSVENLTAPCAELREIHSISPRIRGVLGQDFLSRFNYILNYRDQRIEFEENGEFENSLLGTRVHVGRDRGRVIIAVQPSPPRKQACAFVLDSGAARMVLFKSALGTFEVVMDHGRDRFAYGSTVLGKQLIATGRLQGIRVGDESLGDVPVSIIEAREAMEGRREDGLLPTSLFRSIYFNNKTDHVILNPEVQDSGGHRTRFEISHGVMSFPCYASRAGRLLKCKMGWIG